MRARSIIAPFAISAAIVGLHRPLCAQQLTLDSPFAPGHVQATLVSDVEAIVPGEPFRVGVLLEIEDTWHVNWINPGDAGLAPAVAWLLPEGFSAGELDWPHPGRFPVGHLVVFGYERRVILNVRVTPPPGLTPGSRIRIGAEASWLACQEACIPGEASLSLELPVATKRQRGAHRDEFVRTEERVPVVSPQWRMEGWYQDDETIVLDMQALAAPGRALEDVFFFPYEQGIIENAGPQRLSPDMGGAGYRLEIARSRMVRATPERLAGVIVSKTGWGAGGGVPALAVDVLLYPTPR